MECAVKACSKGPASAGQLEGAHELQLVLARIHGLIAEGAAPLSEAEVRSSAAFAQLAHLSCAVGGA